MQKAFCEHCRAYQSYSIKETVLFDEIHFFSYEKLNAICGKCQIEIFVPEIWDENLSRRMKAFEKGRKKNGS